MTPPVALVLIRMGKWNSATATVARPVRVLELIAYDTFLRRINICRDRSNHVWDQTASLPGNNLICTSRNLYVVHEGSAYM